MEQPYHTSTLNALLPSGLQLRLPSILSIRRLFSSLNSTSITRSTDINQNSGIQLQQDTRDADSPRLCYNYSFLDRLIDHEGIAPCYYEIQKFKEEKLLKIPETVSPEVIEGGIVWKFAYHGFNLLKLVFSESAPPTLTNAPFARYLYIHSLTYLLRALPPDLNKYELISVEAALPRGIIDHKNLNQPNLKSKIRPTSFLHRILASTIIHLFILFQLVLPYILTLLSLIWQYQNQHQIIAKMTRSCFELGIGVGEAMKGLGETKIGDMLIATVQWLIEGIIGGIGEGLIEVLGRKN